MHCRRRTPVNGSHESSLLPLLELDLDVLRTLPCIPDTVLNAKVAVGHTVWRRWWWRINCLALKLDIVWIQRELVVGHWDGRAKELNGVAFRMHWSKG